MALLGPDGASQVVDGGRAADSGLVACGALNDRAARYTQRAAVVALLCVIAAALLAAMVAGLVAVPARTPAHAQAANDAGGRVCSDFGGGPPYRFETYEATRDRAPYLSAQRLAAVDALLPSDPVFALPATESGPAHQRVEQPDGWIPDVLLHAMAWVESRLNQAAIGVPYESSGPVVISSSCAYGVMQVASWFSNHGDVPSRAEVLAGTHYAYNIAAGASILVEKWNEDVFPVVGLGEREYIESWYYALWAYNGWATSNHPAGPEVDPFRSLPYDCERPYNGYTYQELVIGCLINPPSLNGRPLWPALPVEHPDLATLAQPGGPLDPEHFFAGRRQRVARPFEAMNAPLPPDAAPYEPDGARRRGGRGGAAGDPRRPARRRRCAAAGAGPGWRGRAAAVVLDPQPRQRAARLPARPARCVAAGVARRGGGRRVAAGAPRGRDVSSPRRGRCGRAARGGLRGVYPGRATAAGRRRRVGARAGGAREAGRAALRSRPAAQLTRRRRAEDETMQDRLTRAMRRNHGLEHATVAVLRSRRGAALRVDARAATDGFYVYANVAEAELLSAADEALTRLQGGEWGLALSPNCTTNLAAGGVLAGLSTLALARRTGGWKGLLEAVVLGLLSTAAAQPLGRWAQQHLTTSPDVSQTRILRVRAGGHGRGRYLKVETSRPVVRPEVVPAGRA